MISNNAFVMNIAGLERHLPLCPLPTGDLIAAFIMFNDVELTIACAEKLLEKAPDYDLIITAESKGIPLAYEMARQSGKEYLVARKGPKLYMKNIITVEVDSITTESKQILCLGEDDAARIQGKKVLLVDDVISTGESMHALEKLMEIIGGNVAARMAVLAEGDAIDRNDIVILENLPIFDSEGNPK